MSLLQALWCFKVNKQYTSTSIHTRQQTLSSQLFLTLSVVCRSLHYNVYYIYNIYWTSNIIPCIPCTTDAIKYEARLLFTFPQRCHAPTKLLNLESGAHHQPCSFVPFNRHWWGVCLCWIETTRTHFHLMKTMGLIHLRMKVWANLTSFFLGLFLTKKFRQI